MKQSKAAKEGVTAAMRPAICWLGEGFDTLDLKEAKTLLDKLA